MSMRESSTPLGRVRALGKVAVDDYVNEPGNSFLLNGLVKFAGVGGAALALFSLAKIAFRAAA